MRDINKLPNVWVLFKGVLNNLAVALGALASLLNTVNALKQGELIQQQDRVMGGLDLSKLFQKRPADQLNSGMEDPGEN